MTLHVTPAQFVDICRLAERLGHPTPPLAWEIGLRRILGPGAVDRLAQAEGTVPRRLDLIVGGVP